MKVMVEVEVEEIAEQILKQLAESGDVIQIVRCKDCQRFEPIENGTGACVDGYGSVMGIHADNWFCADGERKC